MFDMTLTSHHSKLLFRGSATSASTFRRPPGTATPSRFAYPPSPPTRRCTPLRSTVENSSLVLPPTVPTVSISYTELKDEGADLSEKIEMGFGPDGLGILSVSDVPGYTLLRQNLLRLAPRLANLPEEVKREVEDPSSRYNIGWSHGKEKLENGKPDIMKGSFYANPVFDVPTTDLSLVKRYPSYCGLNIWPRSALPELEFAFKALGKMILEVGLLLAYHCDRYALNEFTTHGNRSIQEILRRSRCHKGRLLYYFPANQSSSSEGDESMSSWCGWHTDHGSLTGLTRGIFTRDGVELACPKTRGIFTRDGVELACPDIAAGLYVKTRAGQIVKVVYGEDEIAFQIGEVTQILSRGRLCATPHCVRAPKGDMASGVERSTFALFMQPNWDEKLNLPDAHNIHEFTVASGYITFGEYTEMLLDKYYDLRS